MDSPNPICIANELDWIFMYKDPNPLFLQAAEAIKGLMYENECLREGKGHVPMSAPTLIQTKWD